MLKVLCKSTQYTDMFIPTDGNANQEILPLSTIDERERERERERKRGREREREREGERDVKRGQAGIFSCHFCLMASLRESFFCLNRKNGPFFCLN